MASEPKAEYVQLARQLVGSAGDTIALTLVESDTYDGVTRLMKEQLAVVPSQPAVLAAVVTEHQIHALTFGPQPPDGDVVLTVRELWHNGSHSTERSITLRRLTHLIANVTDDELAAITSRE